MKQTAEKTEQVPTNTKKKFFKLVSKEGNFNVVSNK